MALRRWTLLAAIAAVYFVAGKVGLQYFAYVHASASPVWPPAGIALVALLLFGIRVWPAVFLAAFLVNITTAGSVFTSLGIATGTNGPYRGPASSPRIPARKRAETALSRAATIVWFSSTVMRGPPRPGVVHGVRGGAAPRSPARGAVPRRSPR